MTSDKLLEGISATHVIADAVIKLSKNVKSESEIKEYRRIQDCCKSLASIFEKEFFDLVEREGEK